MENSHVRKILGGLKSGYDVTQPTTPENSLSKMDTLFDVGVVKGNFFRNNIFFSTFSFMINTLLFYETAFDPLLN